MRRKYAERADYQRAVNLKATGLSHSAIAREMGEARATVQAWLGPNGIANRQGIVPNVETVVEEVPAAKVRVRVPAGSSAEGTVTRILAMGDAHDTPHLDKRRFRWMGKLGADRGVHWAVSIGDWLTIDSLNSHIGNDTILGKHKSPWLSDMQSAKEAFGEFAIGMGSHKCNKHLVEGNHERRIYFFEEARPEIAGVLTGEFHQLVEDHGWTRTPYGEFKYIAGVGFIHCAINRLNKSYGGKNAENTISNDAVHDIVLGHSHRAVQVRAPKLGPSKHITVLNLGCALPQGHVEAYMYHGATTGWWFGAHVLTLQGGQIASVEQVTMGQLEAMYG